MAAANTAPTTTAAFIARSKPSSSTTFPKQCYCGTKDDFDALTKSDACGMTHNAYCFTDAYETCGRERAISVYSRRLDVDYESMGCFVDDEDNRIMTLKGDNMNMSAEVSKGAFRTATSECLRRLCLCSQYNDTDFVFRDHGWVACGHWKSSSRKQNAWKYTGQ